MRFLSTKGYKVLTEFALPNKKRVDIIGINLKKPMKVIALEKSWLMLNRNGMIQFIDQDPFDLEIDELIILDAIVEENMLYLLTESELIILDLVNSK